MLNTYTAGYPGERVQQVGVALPRLVSGGRAVLGRDSYTGLKRLGEGGFARIFSAQLGSETKALKVGGAPGSEGVCVTLMWVFVGVCVIH